MSLLHHIEILGLLLVAKLLYFLTRKFGLRIFALLPSGLNLVLESSDHMQVLYFSIIGRENADYLKLVSIPEEIFT